MSLDKSLKNLKFDTRMLEANINAGVISAADLKAHLSQLPDSAANSEQIDLEENKPSSAGAATQQH